jgi:RNA polymerase sigma-70 factor (ECF subfamily)
MVSKPSPQILYMQVYAFLALDRCSLVASRDFDPTSDWNDLDLKDIMDIRNGNHNSFENIILRHQNRVASQMRKFSRDPRVVEELVHDVFVEAFQGLRQYSGRGPWTHWLNKIAVRVGYGYWKRQKLSRTLVSLSEEDWQKIAEPDSRDIGATETAELAFALLAELPVNDRLVLTLVYLEDCSLPEVADRTGWTVGGTKVRLHRAKKRIKAVMDKKIK